MSTTAPNPLPSFEQLTYNIYFHEASSTRDGDDADHPALVVLCTWGSASLRALSKYANHYVKLYPGARILLLRTSFGELSMQRFPQRFQSTLEPAVRIIRSTTEASSSSLSSSSSSSSEKARVLVHVFSNGGCFKLMRLGAAYAAAVRKKLPAHALVLDSAPGLSHFGRSLKAFSYVLPKQIVLYQLSFFLVSLYVASWKLLALVALRGRDWTRRMYDLFNDGERRAPLAPAPRLYLYSRSDELVDAADVERHVEAARRDAKVVVRTKEFPGTAHVAHMQRFPDEYWSLVAAFWTEQGLR